MPRFMLVHEMSMTHAHTWFDEQIATYLAGGLSGDERGRFECHAAECARCAEELQRAQNEEQRLRALFADATPPAGFEDRIIARLRTDRVRGRTIRLHPWLAKAAATAAAVMIVGGVGYVATEQLQRTSNTVRTASNLRRIGQAILMYSNDSKQAHERSNFEGSTVQPSSLAPHPSLEYLADAPKRIIDEISAAAAGKSSKDGDSAVERVRTLGMSRPSGPSFSTGLNGAAVRGRSENNHDEDGQNVLTGEGDVEFQQNPFVGVQRDNIYVRRYPPGAVSGGTVGAGASEAQVFSGGLGGWRAETFKPEEFALGTPLAIAGQPADDAETRESEVVGRRVERVEGQTSAPAQQGQGQPSPAVPQVDPQPAPTTSPVIQRKVIRHGQIEFEVDSFDSALGSIMKIVAEENGFIATTNSEKLDNGKVRGTIVVRVSPDRLDTLVLKLRALGDLKRQNLSAQDITKQYHDLESELRAARAIEERLIEIIKTGKGEIKDLLAAEKELANWRGKIEKITGEINYYNNQVSLSTLSIDLIERNISTAAAATEREDVNMGVETEDVEDARAKAISAIDEAKGRIVEAELKKLDAGQLAAKIVAEIPPENAGPVIDRLRQLGKVARLDVQRKQTTPTGATPAPGMRLERQDTRLIVSLYNLANVAPRETTNLNLACADVESVYRTILSRVEKAGGRVVSSALNREKADHINATIQFETNSAEAGPVLLDVRGLGEVMRFAVTENPDTANVTTAKHGFVVQLFSAAQIAPRETVTVHLAATDVPQSYQALVDSARETGRVISSQVSESDRQNVTGTIDLELSRDQRDAFEQVLASAGDVLSRNVTRSPDTQNTIDSKLRVQVSLIGADRVPPRETTTLGLETRNVDSSVSRITTVATSNGGRVIDSTLARESDGRSAARVILDVPLSKSAQVIDQIKSLGELRTERATKNAQVPDGNLARARIEVALASPQAIVAGDEGLWSSIRKGLSTSAAGLMWSLQILVVGLCFVVPWALVLWGGWKLVQRTRRATA